jgi:hypothetical protein
MEIVEKSKPIYLRAVSFLFIWTGFSVGLIALVFGMGPLYSAIPFVFLGIGIVGEIIDSLIIH